MIQPHNPVCTVITSVVLLLVWVGYKIRGNIILSTQNIGLRKDEAIIWRTWENLDLDKIMVTLQTPTY